GLMNFGQAGFMAAGAYGIGVTVYWMQWSFWWGVLFVFVYGAVLPCCSVYRHCACAPTISHS
ncbi:MAG: hypothetical protein ACKOBR_12775, partial [Actinomycetota bacterium]